MMSIELPEAKILAEQMNRELQSKIIKSYRLRDHERLQKIGMLNKDTRTFDQLVGRRIESVTSRGNVIHIMLNNGMNLILGLEYGGKIFFYTIEKAVPKKYHLRIDFSDGTVLTVRLTSMGVIQALKEDDLKTSYVYRRDFNLESISPINEAFTLERFSSLLKSNNKMLKSILVGKDAILVGLSNSAFQDILYRAKLHPKRKASELKADKIQALYDSIRFMLQERIRLGGKDQFYDLHGNQGGYTPAMGPNMKQKDCSICGIQVGKLSLGGGQVYFCSKCQV
jgi:formamidopyrimidine-DNA glycosylase